MTVTPKGHRVRSAMPTQVSAPVSQSTMVHIVANAYSECLTSQSASSVCVVWRGRMKVPVMIMATATVLTVVNALAR